MSADSGHLPKCGDWLLGNAFCICDRLRACEARLEDEWLGRYNAAEQRGYDAGFRNGVLETETTWTHTLRIKQADTYATALAAAREAVAAKWCCSNCIGSITNALATIDALRGES